MNSSFCDETLYFDFTNAHYASLFLWYDSLIVLLFTTLVFITHVCSILDPNDRLLNRYSLAIPHPD